MFGMFFLDWGFTPIHYFVAVSDYPQSVLNLSTTTNLPKRLGRPVQLEYG